MRVASGSQQFTKPLVLFLALLLVPALLLLRHQQADPAASPDPAALTPSADSGPPVAASPQEDEVLAGKEPDEHGDRVDVGALSHEDEVMAGPEPDPLYLELASLQQVRDQDLPVRLPVPHRQTGQVERVNSYAEDQVSATGTLTGTPLRFRLSRFGHTTSVELQDAVTGQFQTWLSQPGRAPALMPVPQGEDLHLDCGVTHGNESDLAWGSGGFDASAAAAHSQAVAEAATHAPSSVQAREFALPAADTPVIDVAIGWFPATLRGGLPELLESRNMDWSPAAVREFFFTRLYANIDYANEALKNSDINLWFNPLVVWEIPDTEYIETGDGIQIVRALRDPDDGKMDDFVRRAEAAGADFFTVIPGTEFGRSGRGYLPGRHSMVSVITTIWDNDTYAHEWGHNLGCHHHRNNVKALTPGLYFPDDYNFGWRFQGIRNNEYHATVMASCKVSEFDGQVCV